MLHLVDIRHDPTEDDITMNQFLRQMGIPFTVIATKADKITRGARQKQLAPICRALLVQPWEIICWSSEDDTGGKAYWKCWKRLRRKKQKRNRLLDKKSRTVRMGSPAFRWE